MFATKIKTGNQKSSRPRGVCKLMAPLTAVRTPSPIEDFYFDKEKPVHATDDCVCIRNDLYMLFNQKRLDRMSLQQFSEWMNHDQTGQTFSELRKHVSDSKLHDFVKSRYIQAPCELRAWAAYLETELSSEIEKARAAQQSQEPPQENAAPAPAAAE